MKILQALVLALLLTFASLGAQNADSLYQAGQAKAADRDFKGAIKDYTSAIKLNADVPEVFLRRAQAEAEIRCF